MTNALAYNIVVFTTSVKCLKVQVQGVDLMFFKVNLLVPLCTLDRFRVLKRIVFINIMVFLTKKNPKIYFKKFMRSTLGYKAFFLRHCLSGEIS